MDRCPSPHTIQPLQPQPSKLPLAPFLTQTVHAHHDTPSTTMAEALVVLAVLVCGGAAANVLVSPRAPSCPVAEDIKPCHCTLTDDIVLDMECSNVLDEDQLLQVFMSYFPDKAFRKLMIIGNMNLKRIREGDLGDLSFQEIIIVEGVLEEIETNAFSMSYPTLNQLLLYSNNIHTFPFEMIAEFTNLTMFNIGTNQITQMPPIASESLKHLYIQFNPLYEIAADVFTSLINIEKIYASNTNLQEIKTGTFAGLPQLSSLYLSECRISHVAAGAIQLTTSQDTYVNLEHNNITDISVGAITGCHGGFVSVSHNLLTELPEELYRPMLEANTEVYFLDNPLACGCDVAWLVLSPDLLPLTHQYAKCADGTYVVDLDPALFVDC